MIEKFCISLYGEDECNFYSAESLHRACNDEKCILTTVTYTVRDRFAVNSSTLSDRTNVVEIRLPKKVSAFWVNFHETILMFCEN
jgi:hypothetical protein